MFVDTHLHVADAHFDADRDAVLERARAAGVSLFIEIAESPAGWPAAVALAEKHPWIYAALGVHPHHAHECGAAQWPELERRLRDFLAAPQSDPMDGAILMARHDLQTRRECPETQRSSAA